MDVQVALLFKLAQDVASHFGADFKPLSNLPGVHETLLPFFQPHQNIIGIYQRGTHIIMLKDLKLLFDNAKESEHLT